MTPHYSLRAPHILSQPHVTSLHSLAAFAYSSLQSLPSQRASTASPESLHCCHVLLLFPPLLCYRCCCRQYQQAICRNRGVDRDMENCCHLCHFPFLRYLPAVCTNLQIGRWGNKALMSVSLLFSPLVFTWGVRDRIWEHQKGTVCPATELWTLPVTKTRESHFFYKRRSSLNNFVIESNMTLCATIIIMCLSRLNVWQAYVSGTKEHVLNVAQGQAHMESQSIVWRVLPPLLPPSPPPIPVTLAGKVGLPS